MSSRGATVETARRALAPVGAFLPVSVDSVAPVDVQLGVLLATTERMVFGAGVATIWARPAQTAHAAPTTDHAPGSAPAHPLILGALGPRMLALAAEIADGAMPAMVPPDATGEARRVLGPDRLLVVLVDGGAAQGDPAAVADLVRDHLAAGADHVTVGGRTGTDLPSGVDRLVELAPALHEEGLR